MNWEIVNTEELDQYGTKILEMYRNSYEKIGLIDFGGWDGMKSYLNCSCYLLKEDDKTLNGIILYWLSEYGNKISLVISLNSDIANKYIIPKLIELLKTPGFYIELSDALEYLIRKKGMENIKDKQIIKMLIPEIKDEDIFDEGDERLKIYPLNKIKNIDSPSGSYLREIKDIGIHRKALYGMPCLKKNFNKEGCNRICNNYGGNIKNYKKNKKNKKNKTLKNNNKRRNKN